LRSDRSHPGEAPLRAATPGSRRDPARLTTMVETTPMFIIP
ncbi:hypothetical protein A2U01_0113180, partial [Trifolium medium]|nr:hypothetical protein [Trifolium medium]